MLFQIIGTHNGNIVSHKLALYQIISADQIPACALFALDAIFAGLSCPLRIDIRSLHLSIPATITGIESRCCEQNYK